MFIAHLPAGYLLNRGIGSRIGRSPRWALAAGLVGSVFPDLDLVYFYLLDHQQHVHHSYWIHKPLYWAAIALVFHAWVCVSRSEGMRVAGLFFFPNVFGHLVLDTWVGHIRWLSPFTERSFALVEVPARFDGWVLNFVLHWSFGAELAIVAAAAGALWAQYCSNRTESGLETIHSPGWKSTQTR